jgi:hypothetical protein
MEAPRGAGRWFSVSDRSEQRHRLRESVLREASGTSDVMRNPPSAARCAASTDAAPPSDTDASRTGRDADGGKDRSVQVLMTGKSSVPGSGDADSAPSVNRPARWCAIVLKRIGRSGRFEVVAVSERGERRAVAESPAFKLSRSGQASERGPAKAAHARLAGQLAAVGWTPVTTRGRWHDSSFVQSRDDVPHQRYLLIGLTRERSVGRFQADEMDAYGNATLVEQSEEFEVLLKESDVTATEAARSAHEHLVMKLVEEGWTPDGVARGEWYAAAMTKLQDGDHDETATAVAECLSDAWA